MVDDLIFSRPIATAAVLGDFAPDNHRFVDKVVLLTGETEILKTANGRACFINSLLLLHRISKTVEVFLPSGLDGIQNECNDIVNKISNSSIRILPKQPAFSAYDAILSVGAAARESLPWTVINSNGWLARVSSLNESIPSDTCDYNPIAALAAACLGVTEIFKRLVRLKETRGMMLNSTSFSLYSYKTGENDLGPELPKKVEVSLLLVGVGAIGNGIVHLFNQLPIAGNVSIVDYQKYGLENIGTCLLIGQSELGKPKALFAEDYLGRDLARGFVENIQQFSERLRNDIPAPKIILNALDNIDARHIVQDLWPDVIFDGAIGDFSAQVSRHPWSEDIACLKCLLQKPTGEASEIVGSRATGLRPERISNADDVVTEEDIESAPDKMKAWLKERKGRKICSIVQEGVIQQISDAQQNNNFQPSVPFVACLSASMVVAELIKYVAGWPTPLECRFQFDALVGPAQGQFFPQNRRRDCICSARRRNIETIRRNRLRQ